VPPVPDGALRMDLNENPFPWPDDLWREVGEALRGAEPTRYPRGTDRLQAALAAYAGVPPDWCLPANGSDELLLGAVTAWGRRAVRAVYPVPTFGMYRRLAEAAGLPGVRVPLGPAPDFALPVDALRHALSSGGESLLFLCRPNNPTGTLWPEDEVRALVDTDGVWTVLDEAYVEFAGDEGLVSWLAHRPRLCILRTMSKAFALAGLRVGYALGLPEALAPLRQAVQPWAVTSFSAAAALAALGRRAALRAQVALLVQERERLAAGLAAVPGIRPVPSRGNYVLFGVEGCDAFALFDRLYAGGAVLRRFPEEPALRGCLRVSVGRPEENDRFLGLLRAAVDAERGRAADAGGMPGGGA
jgi:histidinol-phosphate aminotransferase